MNMLNGGLFFYGNSLHSHFLCSCFSELSEHQSELNVGSDAVVKIQPLVDSRTPTPNELVADFNESDNDL
jgi:hypothetical protein